MEGRAAAVIDGTPPRFVVSQREEDIAVEQISIIRGGRRPSEGIRALTFCDTCDV